MKTINNIILYLGFLICSGICEAQSVKLYTPRGGVVYAFTNIDLTDAENQTETEAFKKRYPHATVLANATRKYNCHSYAWHLTSGGTGYFWMNQLDNWANNLSNYWTDNSYLVSSEAVAEKIFYYEGDHSAVRSSVGGKYESKWGQGPLVRHDPDYGPYNNMKNRRYYVRNVKVSTNSLISSTGTTVNITNSGTFKTPTTWTYSSNLQLVSNSNSSAVFKSTSNAAGWVRASFNGYTTKDLQVWAGKPVITDVTGNRNVKNGQYVSFRAVFDYNSAPTRFEWILNPQNGNSVYGATSANCDITFYNPGSYQLVVRATNANGTGDYYVTGVSVSNAGYYSYMVYPNPTSDVLIVNFNTKTSSGSLQSLSTTSEQIKLVGYTIRLYNEKGNIVRQSTSKDQQVEFDVSNLTDGLYYLHVDNGSGAKPGKHKVIVKH